MLPVRAHRRPCCCSIGWSAALGRAVLPSAVKPGQVLLLAALSILTHPILDTLNTYGVRWLMPFRGDWYYGDTLFIVDPWLWLVLGVGVVASRRPRRPRGHDPGATRPRGSRWRERLATWWRWRYRGIGRARHRAARARRALGGPVERLMVAPRPLTPFVRQVVAAQGERYGVGTFRWLATPARADGVAAQLSAAARPDDPVSWPRARRAAGPALPRLGPVSHRAGGHERRRAGRWSTSSTCATPTGAGAGFGSVTLPLGPADRDQFDVIVYRISTPSTNSAVSRPSAGGIDPGGHLEAALHAVGALFGGAHAVEQHARRRKAAGGGAGGQDEEQGEDRTDRQEDLHWLLQNHQFVVLYTEYCTLNSNLGGPMATIARAPLSDEVYRQVLQRIHRGDLAPAAESGIPTSPPSSASAGRRCAKPCSG